MDLAAFTVFGLDDQTFRVVSGNFPAMFFLKFGYHVFSNF